MKQRLSLKKLSGNVKGLTALSLVMLLGISKVEAQCPVTTFPWTETFEDASTTRSCWTQQTIVGSMQWTYRAGASGTGVTAAQSGTKNADFTAQTANFNMTKLISPVLNLGGAPTATLSFFWSQRSWAGDINRLTVFYRTSPSDPWIQTTFSTTSAQNNWTSSGNITLPSTTSTYQIAFECEDLYGYPTVVDQVVVNGTPCIAPTTPVITQGASITRCANSAPTTLSLTGTLNSATTWQWYSGSCGGTPVGTGTSIDVSPTTTTTYYVRGTGGCVTNATCAQITVNVNQPPAITTQPVAATLCSGGTINLSVAANNAASYQWYFQNGIIAGATSASFSVPNATSAYTGGYHVVVNGNSPCASATSNTVNVTVNNPVSITTQPVAVNDCEGNAVNLNVAANNVSAYQWYNQSGVVNNTTSITGATTANLTINPSTAADMGTYYAILSGLPGCPSVNTGNAGVSLTPPVAITTQTPATLGVCDGTALNLSVVAANGNGYQWYKDNSQLAGETNSTLTIANMTAADAGNYYVEVTGNVPCPNVNSVTTAVTHDLPAAITSQPTDITECHGVGTSINVGATGANLVYDWYLGNTLLTNTTPYSGQGTSSLAISDVSNLNSNEYHVVVTGSCGSPVTSDTIVLTENFDNNWTGNVDNYWNNAGNWACGILPTTVTNAVVPDVPNLPIVNVQTAVCKDLVIAPNASVTFNGTNNKLAVHGNIMNNGTLDGTGGVGGTIEMAGTAQSIAGPVVLENLNVTGGGIKTLGGNTLVNGTLNLDNGHLELGNNALLLAQPTAQTGGGPASFIVTNGTGEVVGANMGAVGGNAAPVTFHVGINATSYTPIMLENLGDADGFRVRVVENVYQIGDDITSPIVTNPVVTRTWMVSENTTGGSIVNMTPMWNSPLDQTVDFDQNHVFVSHYLNNEWISYVDSANAAPAADPGPLAGMLQTTQDSIENFSPFTVASAGQFPLAIRLNAIVATNAGLRNKVQWTSAKEDKGDIYELESSADGKQFTKIATVTANGTPSTYTQWDENPVQGVNYYRVKLLNNNGTFSYSKVVTATVKGKDGFAIEAYPNPVSSTVSVKVNGVVKGNATVVVTDVTGKVVKEKVQVVDNNATINVSNLPAGIYMINYADDLRNESIKITKQ
jgi:hypothetical protein